MLKSSSSIFFAKKKKKNVLQKLQTNFEKIRGVSRGEGLGIESPPSEMLDFLYPLYFFQRQKIKFTLTKSPRNFFCLRPWKR